MTAAVMIIQIDVRGAPLTVRFLFDADSGLACDVHVQDGTSGFRPVGVYGLAFVSAVRTEVDRWCRAQVG